MPTPAASRVELSPLGFLRRSALALRHRPAVVHALVAFCDLPRTPTGKIEKCVLREKEWQGREKAIG